MVVDQLGRRLQPSGWCRVSTAGDAPPLEALAEFEGRCTALVGLDARKQAARDRAALLGTVAELSARERQAERDACKRAGLTVTEFDELCPRRDRPRMVTGEARPDDADTAGPERLVNVSFGNPYRYTVGTGSYPRGMYERQRTDGGDFYWQYRSSLPYVLARVVRRDGSQRRTGTEYLIAADPDGTRVIVTDDELKDGLWARKLGVNLSGDHYIVTAVATAIRDTAHRDAHEREATARPDVNTASGHVDIPVAECLPPAYLRMPPLLDTEQARTTMREVALIVAGRPKMALTMGASAAAPFVGPLRRQSHWWDLYGDSRKGKSTAQAVAASLWGDARVGTGIVLGWDASGIGLGRWLGQLGILPPFFDERGLAPFSSDQWGEHIYSTCQGSSRLTAERLGSGTRRSAPWFGVLFSTGNARLTDRIGAGRFAGIPARVIELEAPFTEDHNEAKKLTDELLPRCYGWLGPAILERNTVPMVRDLLDVAATAVGIPPNGGIPGTLAEHLHIAVAGAMMLDAELGTGTALADAAIIAAKEYLAVHGHEPEHDADRMLNALAESLVSRRSAWPSVAEFVELAKARAEFIPGQPSEIRPILAQHGYDHQSSGIRSDDGEWLYVMPEAWRSITDEIGADSSVACAELYRRGVLHVPSRTRNEGKWTARPRIGGRKLPGIYQVTLAAIERDGQEDGHDQTGPIGPATGASNGQEPAPDPASVAALGLLSDQLGAKPVEPDTEPTQAAAERTTGEPCAICQTQGAFCALGGVAEIELPCVLCGVPTPVRSRCGAPRTGICHGPEKAGERTTGPAEGDDLGRGASAPRGASRVVKARAAAREATAETSSAALAAGEPLRLLRALETSHAPMRRVDGRMRKPYLRPEIPGITYATHIVAGYSWSRPYSGAVAVLDRSGAWPAAASSAVVAHGELAHTGDLEFSGCPGYYQVQRHPWLEADSMPDPLGNARGETVWVPGPTVALLCELAEENRWADVAVLDSYTADGVRLSKWADYVKALRTEAITAYGRSSDQYADVKESFSRAVSMMQGQPLEAWKCGVQRPDWAHTIKTQASATLWRWADACRKVAPEYPPISVRNVDELVIPEPALEIVTTIKAPGRASPVKLDPEGVKLGTFKVKASEEWKGSQA